MEHPLPYTVFTVFILRRKRGESVSLRLKSTLTNDDVGLSCWAGLSISCMEPEEALKLAERTIRAALCVGSEAPTENLPPYCWAVNAIWWLDGALMKHTDGVTPRLMNMNYECPNTQREPLHLNVTGFVFLIMEIYASLRKIRIKTTLCNVPHNTHTVSLSLCWFLWKQYLLFRMLELKIGTPFNLYSPPLSCRLPNQQQVSLLLFLSSQSISKRCLLKPWTPPSQINLETD